MTKYKTCSVCRKALAGKLCEFRPARGKRRCSRPLCDRCAVSIDFDVDWCPTHPLPKRQSELEL
jgi:hypothetical protein